MNSWTIFIILNRKVKHVCEGYKEQLNSVAILVPPQKQETYTPRLLSIDIKGNLGSLPVDGSLYSPQRNDLSVNEASWHGHVELIKQLPEEKNEYLMDLEIEDSRYFTQRDEDKDICMG